MSERLFEPIQLGDIKLGHRMAMAPLTRFRANDDYVHQPMAAEYYEQRASTPGTLLISEATYVSAQAGGYYNVPGLYNEDQIKAWKAVTDAVHKKGSFIYAQLWALGRVANPKALAKDGLKLVSSSDVPVAEGAAKPNPLTVDEIKQFVADYATAASNAIRAGFDGVEIHAANGYLPDQFTSPNSNKRDDKYGGSIEKRSTFVLEVVDAVTRAIGSQKVGIRLSPWSPFQGMDSKDPVPQFSHLIGELRKFNLAYLHLVESRSSGDVAVAEYHSVTNANDKFLQIWGTSNAVILAGGFTPEKAKKAVGEVYTGDNIIIAFGRSFISTPDLPYRIKNGIELNKYDRSTFYLKKDPRGYIDQPFSKQFIASQSRL